MSRILRIVLIEVAIISLVAFVLCFARHGHSTSPMAVWDYDHNLIHPTYPAQDLKGNFLSPPNSELRTREENDMLRDRLRELQTVRKKK